MLSSDANSLIDPGALLIVLVGTLLATCARSGWRDIAAAVPAALTLGRKEFDGHATRSALAKTVREIERLGHLGAQPVDPPDAPSLALLNTYIRSGSIDSMRTLALAQRTERENRTAACAKVFENAGELAPVFGLVGTLFAISQLMPEVGVGSAEIVMASVASAVLSTLYGVLGAHMIFYPVARAIERKGGREELARAKIISWFEAELSGGRTRKTGTKSSVAGLRGAA